MNLKFEAKETEKTLLNAKHRLIEKIAKENEKIKKIQTNNTPYVI